MRTLSTRRLDGRAVLLWHVLQLIHRLRHRTALQPRRLQVLTIGEPTWFRLGTQAPELK